MDVSVTDQWIAYVCRRQGGPFGCGGWAGSLGHNGHTWALLCGACSPHTLLHSSAHWLRTWPDRNDNAGRGRCTRSLRKKHTWKQEKFSPFSAEIFVRSYAGRCGCCPPLRASRAGHWRGHRSARSSRLQYCADSHTEESPARPKQKHCSASTTIIIQKRTSRTTFSAFTPTSGPSAVCVPARFLQQHCFPCLAGSGWHDRDTCSCPSSSSRWWHKTGWGIDLAAWEHHRGRSSSPWVPSALTALKETQRSIKQSVLQ